MDCLCGTHKQSIKGAAMRYTSDLTSRKIIILILLCKCMCSIMPYIKCSRLYYVMHISCIINEHIYIYVYCCLNYIIYKSEYERHHVHNNDT